MSRARALLAAYISVGLLTLCPPMMAVTRKSAHAPRYAIADLGPLVTRALNDRPGLGPTSVVAAWREVGTSHIHGTLIEQGEVHDLGELPPYANTFCSDLNERKMVVGMAQASSDLRDTQAFLWQEGNLERLPGLGGRSSAAQAINAKGEIAGSAQLPNHQFHAVLWTNSIARDLGTLPGGDFSKANALNNRSEIVGESNSSTSGQPHGVFWLAGHIHDLGLLPHGTFSSAQAVNSKGQIAGFADSGRNGIRPILWSDKRVVDLGTLGDDPSMALDVNNAGSVVGTSSVAEGQMRAFLWQHGHLYNLNHLLPKGSGWLLMTAFRINNRGEILGRGFYRGEAHAFLLSPRAGD
jgi:probable HAF family extracellular repeat protein